MARYKAVVSYDGTNYIGWQRQANGISVQEVIEDVIYKISKCKTTIVASGRTDAKVHARGQVFHFDTEFDLKRSMWKKALNGHLPEDIHIVSCDEVKTNFHSRFHSNKKCYEYWIHINEPDVFYRNYAFQCYYKLDVNKMIHASKLFVGKHDFSSFCANSFETHPNQVRDIYSINFSEENNLIKIRFEGKGFLRYMVRMIVGTLIEVGRGRLNNEDVVRMLEEKNKEACRYNAKPQGLYLVEVGYDEGWEIPA